MIKCEIEGLNSIEQELEDEFMPRVDRAIQKGLSVTASDMTISLEKHIRSDVYEKYTPLAYIRRARGGMLNTDETIDTKIEYGDTLYFTYNFPVTPSFWREDSKYMKYGYYEFMDGDDAIRAIQDGKNYPTVTPMGIPPRPFWDNFLTEQLIGRDIEKSFVKGVNMADGDLGAEEVGGYDLRDRQDSDDLHDKPEYGKVKFNGKDGSAQMPF